MWPLQRELIVMMWKSLAAACCGLAFVAPLAEAASPLTFALTGKPALTGVYIGAFNPGTLDRGAIETQTAAMRQPVTGFGLALGSAPECGGEADIAAALARPNFAIDDQAMAPLDGRACLFAAELSIVTDREPRMVRGRCEGWRNDVSTCWLDGDMGAFNIRRRGTNAAQLDLLIGGPATIDSAPETAFSDDNAPATTGSIAPPVSSRGIMLESDFDDAGRAVADLWLLLPQGGLTLTFQRP